MSLTSPIPKALREEMDADPWYHQCCLTELQEVPGIRIEWHHAFRFAGKRVNEKWCIVPLWDELHKKADQKWVKDHIDRIILNRADDATLLKYSKGVDLFERRGMLNRLYGKDPTDPAILYAYAKGSVPAGSRGNGAQECVD